MEIISIIILVRVSALVLCMAIAAKSDYENLMVADSHWLKWSIIFVFLLFLEMILLETSISNYYMIAALLAIFSIAFFGTPQIKNILEWKKFEFSIALLYLIGFVGIVGGALENQNTDFISLILGEESPDTVLWWSLILSMLIISLYLIAWKSKIIQGGADIKALILLTITFPSWSFLPEPLFMEEEILFRLPPSLVMFVWAGLVFLLAPPILIFYNYKKGNISSRHDIIMAWHSIKLPIDEIGSKPVWILTEVLEEEDEIREINRILPKTNYSMFDEIEEKKNLLKSKGIESAWVASKHPFIVYLFLSILPLLLIGDLFGIIASYF